MKKQLLVTALLLGCIATVQAANENKMMSPVQQAISAAVQTAQTDSQTEVDEADIQGFLIRNPAIQRMVFRYEKARLLVKNPLFFILLDQNQKMQQLILDWPQLLDLMYEQPQTMYLLIQWPQLCQKIRNNPSLILSMRQNPQKVEKLVNRVAQVTLEIDRQIQDDFHP